MDRWAYHIIVVLTAFIHTAAQAADAPHFGASAQSSSGVGRSIDDNGITKLCCFILQIRSPWNGENMLCVSPPLGFVWSGVHIQHIHTYLQCWRNSDRWTNQGVMGTESDRDLPKLPNARNRLSPVEDGYHWSLMIRHAIQDACLLLGRDYRLVLPTSRA